MESENQSEAPLAYKKMNTRIKTLKLPTPNLSDDQSEQHSSRRKKVFKSQAKSRKTVQKERTKIYTKTSFEENYTTFLKKNIVPKFDDLQNVFQKFLELKPVVFESVKFVCESEQLNLFNRKYEVIEKCLEEIEQFKAQYCKLDAENSVNGLPFHLVKNALKDQGIGRNASNQTCDEIRESTCNQTNFNKSIGSNPVQENSSAFAVSDPIITVEKDNGQQNSFIKRPAISIETADLTSEKKDTNDLLDNDQELKPTASQNSTKKLDGSEITEQEGLVEYTSPVTAGPILKTNTFINCDLRYFNFSLLTANLGSFDGKLISNHDGPAVAYQRWTAQRQFFHVWQQQVLPELQHNVQQ